MNSTVKILFNSLLIISMLSNCSPKEKGIDSSNTLKETFIQGTFAYDHEFLKKYKEVIVLKSRDGQAQLIICPEYQGRVMTSTAEGRAGYSFGWLNHDLIASGEVLEHINPVGGEDRLWLGPEGGQYSIFHKPGVSFDFENWYVPKELDTEPFHTVSSNTREVVFEKSMTLKNYSNSEFKLSVKRTIRLLEKNQISSNLAMDIPISVNMVGFESENILTNQGAHTWNKDSGMLSIWILNMFNPSPRTTVVIPFKKGNESELGKIVTDEYYGKVSADRLVVRDGVLFFKADGKKRSKIGISPKRALPIAGSYDAAEQALTIVQFTISGNTTDYVNSLLKIQDAPFEGDAVNSYNDGPLKNGGQLGPFYELESSSPAAALQSGESLTHVHRTYHFVGDEKDLNLLAIPLLGVDIAAITSAL